MAKRLYENDQQTMAYTQEVLPMDLKTNSYFHVMVELNKVRDTNRWSDMFWKESREPSLLKGQLNHNNNNN